MLVLLINFSDTRHLVAQMVFAKYGLREIVQLPVETMQLASCLIYS